MGGWDLVWTVLLAALIAAGALLAMCECRRGNRRWWLWVVAAALLLVALALGVITAW